MTAATLDRPASHTEAGRVPFSYERKSTFRVKDLDMEVTRGVHRQRNDAITACRNRNLGDPEHITDEGQSASRFATKARTGWPLLLDAIRARRVSYVVVWLLDRAIRQGRDLEDLLDACRETGTLILQSGTGTVIDADDPDSVALAKIQGALAEAEVAKTSKRVRRVMAEKRALGQFSGGKRRFGYAADMKTVDEAEAAIIRDLARGIIAGRSLHSLAKELNAADTPTPSWKGIPFRMSAWTGSNIGTMMRGAHLAGMQTHRGKVIGPATWPAILDPETFDAVCGVLGDSARVSGPGNARRWLLSGIVRCGVPECGKPVRVHKYGGTAARTTHTHGYRCPEYHVARPTGLVEAVVVSEAIGRLSDPDFEAAFLPPDDTDRDAIESRIEVIERNLEDVESRRMLGTTTPRAADKATADGMAELTRLGGRLRAMAARATLPMVFDGVAGPDAAAAWDGLDLDRRRAVIEALMAVTMLPAGKGAAFDPDSIAIRWRTETD